MRSVALRKSEKGQAAVLIALLMGVMIVIVAATTNMGKLVTEKMAMQNAVDLAVYSGAATQAGHLNQMRRINQIYAVLSDPERRRRYDADTTQPERFPMIVPAPPLRRLPLTGLLWGGAAIAICGFVLWLADRDSGYSSREFAFLDPRATPEYPPS